MYVCGKAIVNKQAPPVTIFLAQDIGYVELQRTVFVSGVIAILYRIEEP